MVVINSNKTNLVSGGGDCKCYVQALENFVYGSQDFSDSEKCYQHCCVELCSDSYVYISKNLLFLHMCNETLVVRFNKNVAILRGTLKV